LASPSFKAIHDDPDLGAYVAKTACLTLIAPHRKFHSLQSLSLPALLDAYCEGGPEVESSLRVLRRMGALVPVLSPLTSTLLSLAGTGKPRWRESPVPLAEFAKLAATNRVSVGHAVATFVDSMRYSDFPPPPKAWESLIDVELSQESAQYVARLLGDRTEIEGVELLFVDLLQIALLEGKKPYIILREFAWLSRVGVRLPVCPETFIAEHSDPSSCR
jgi:hypothetical protein